MPLVVTSVPNLAQGVSQQPDNLRYPGQCDEQINAWSTVVEGLVKRPNTRWVNQFNSGSTPTNLFTHFVKRSEGNKYCVTVSLGSSVSIGQVGVIDLETGNKVSVATTSIANSYLTGISNPLQDIRALTVADYTFLVNTKKQVAKDADLYSNPPEEEALFVVKMGDYSKGYSMYVDDVLMTIQSTSSLNNTHHDPNHVNTHGYSLSYISGPSSAAYHADTEFIANHLARIITENRATSTVGIGDITVTDGGSGWLQNLYGRIKDIDRNIFGKKTIEYHLTSVTTQPTKLEFFITQVSSGRTINGKILPFHTIQTFLPNSSASGFCNVQNGEIQDFVFTNKGSNYDAITSDPETALNLVLVEKVYMDGRWQRAERFTQTVDPTYAALAVETLPALSVERSGSVIKIKKTISVSNGGKYYVLREPHESNSETEPGIGVKWELYWDEVPSSAGATAWSSGTSYFAAQDIKIHASDGLANEGLGAINKEVQSITDLPKQCYNNFSVKVKGDADIDQDDYYVRFRTKDKDDFGLGTWVERSGWQVDETESNLSVGIQLNYDFETMPITLVPVFTGSDITSFKLQSPEEDLFGTVEAPKEVGWRSRKAGDDDTNPFPSFVGSKINDVFFFKNRLGFLTDSNVIFSEADEYFNFFRTTNQQLLDSAPIDVGLSHTKVAVLQYALPFQEKLMLFSKQSQFVLRGADVLSPKTVAISPVTEYDISDGIAPLALGSYIYFPFNRGQYEGMFEYFVDNNTEVFEAEEITSQIPKYIPSKLRAMAGSASESMVVLQNTTDLTTLYVYKYFWSGKEKIQSAWQKWEFADNVTGFDFIDSTLYLILNSQQLVQMPVENALTDEGLDYTLLLDNRVDGARDHDEDGSPDLTVSYDSLDNETTISNLPAGYGVEVTTDVDGNVTSTNVAVYTKGGSSRTVSGSGASTTVKIDGFIASYVDNGGDYVEYDGDYYYCIISHTSTSTFESKYWRKAVYPPSGTPDWSASTSYNRGTIYKCETNHTSPDTFVAVDTSVTPNVTYWSASTDVPSAPEWGSNIFYNNDRYFVVGKPYNMLYRFSNQALKQPTERGGRSASDYTFQNIRNASIEYADTGHFTVEVTPRFRDTYTYVYNPALLSSISTLDRFTPESGHFRFGVQCRPEEVTIEVKSSSALPVKLLAAEFESMVTGRSKRYGA